MIINKTNAIKLWNERYGKQTQTVKDFAGRIMTKGQFGDTNSKSGWTIDHRQPQSKGGSNVKCNLEIVNHETNSEKGNKTTFTANGKLFQVQKDGESGKGCYKIVELESDTSTNEPKKKLNNKREFAEALYKDTVIDDMDFAEREINFESFETDDDDAWSIGFYTKNKELSFKNCFVAHINTIADQSGKTNFKSNDYIFELKKVDGQYHYINISKILDDYDFYNVLGFTKNLYSQDRTIHRDLITLKVNYDDEKDLGNFLILLEQLLSCLPHKNNYYLAGGRFSYYSSEKKVHIIFETPKENDTCTAHEFAMYMNTLKSYLIDIAGINHITIYHSVHAINSSEYSKFIDNIDNQFESEVYNNQTDTIFLTEDVKNYLTNCNYKNNSFTEHDEGSYYERNYIFQNFLDIIKKFN